MELFVSTYINIGSVKLSPEESHHVAKVLRMQPGETIHVTDGRGAMGTGAIVSVSPKSVEVNITYIQQHQAPIPVVHLFVSPTRTTDRTEWLIEKATELGCSSIQFVLCERTARKHLNLERYKKIALAASKQNLNCHFPKIDMIQNFEDAVKSAEGEKLIAYCFGDNRLKPPAWPVKSDTYSVFIGPEGDFTENEVSHALHAGCVPVEMGALRLRTETAALTAISYLRMRHQLE